MTQKLTQHELIIEYIKQTGSIVPAKLKDSDRAFRNQWIGSEASKRCRELRAEGKLTSIKEGKYERYYLKGQLPQTDNVRSFLAEWGAKPKVEEKLLNALF